MIIYIIIYSLAFVTVIIPAVISIYKHINRIKTIYTTVSLTGEDLLIEVTYNKDSNNMTARLYEYTEILGHKIKKDTYRSQTGTIIDVLVSNIMYFYLKNQLDEIEQYNICMKSMHQSNKTINGYLIHWDKDEIGKLWDPKTTGEPKPNFILNPKIKNLSDKK